MTTYDARPRTGSHESDGRAICPNTVAPKWGDLRWPCVGAAGHDGDCRPSPEHADYPRPFTDMTRDELLSAAIVHYLQEQSARRDAITSARLDYEQGRDLNRLLDHAQAHGAGRSAKHDGTCWMRHVSCLAQLVRWRSDMSSAELARVTPEPSETEAVLTPTRLDTATSLQWEPDGTHRLIARMPDGKTRAFAVKP